MSNLRVHVADSVGSIIIDRPELRNALSREMWIGISSGVERCVADGARAIVITGAGRCFAAGADFSDLHKIEELSHAADLWDAISTALNTVAACPVPTIARVIGPCMGGGCLLAVACDLRFCEPSARFSVPVAKLGIALDQANINRLLSLVGRGIAAEMLYTGMVMSAARAEQVGLVNAVVPDSDLDNVLSTIITAICDNSPQATGRAKTQLRAGLLGQTLSDDLDAVLESYLSQDFRDRIRGVVKDAR